jgi:glycosyltransferase involved in cell wall biosynthesis
MRESLQQTVQEHELQNHVRFLGFKNSDEIPEVLARMTVLVLPSRREPRGLVAVEAMAAGTIPVVSSATGVWGDGDAVEDGVTGFVYPQGEAPRLAAILGRLMNFPNLVADLSEAARSRALAYGPESFAASTADALARASADR